MINQFWRFVVILGSNLGGWSFSKVLIRNLATLKNILLQTLVAYGGRYVIGRLRLLECPFQPCVLTVAILTIDLEDGIYWLTRSGRFWFHIPEGTPVSIVEWAFSVANRNLRMVTLVTWRNLRHVTCKGDSPDSVICSWKLQWEVQKSGSHVLKSKIQVQEGYPDKLDAASVNNTPRILSARWCRHFFAVQYGE